MQGRQAHFCTPSAGSSRLVHSPQSSLPGSTLHHICAPPPPLPPTKSPPLPSFSTINPQHQPSPPGLLWISPPSTPPSHPLSHLLSPSSLQGCCFSPATALESHLLLSAAWSVSLFHNLPVISPLFCLSDSLSTTTASPSLFWIYISTTAPAQLSSLGNPFCFISPSRRSSHTRLDPISLVREHPSHISHSLLHPASTSIAFTSRVPRFPLPTLCFHHLPRVPNTFSSYSCKLPPARTFVADLEAGVGKKTHHYTASAAQSHPPPNLAIFSLNSNLSCLLTSQQHFFFIKDLVMPSNP